MQTGHARCPDNSTSAKRQQSVSSCGLWVGLGSIILLLLSSALNLALRMPSRGSIAEEFEKSDIQGAFERFLRNRPAYMLSTAIIRSIAVIALIFSAVGLSQTENDPVDNTRLLVAAIVAWITVLIFGIAIPHAWAKYAGEWLIVRCLWSLALARLICSPILAVLTIFDPIVRRLAGVPVKDPSSHADDLEQQILNVVSEGKLHGAVDEGEKEMIESVIELGDMRVEEIMTPRTEVVALPVDADLDAVLDLIRTKGHSRIPVYEETIDTALGILYAKDLLRRDLDSPFELRKLMRKAFYIPESKPVPDLLAELKKQKVHMAIVLDEYGGTAGIVTLEDILEELVGELADEYETPEPIGIEKISETTYEIDARTRIDDLEDEIDIEIPDDKDYETIGGFVFSRLGRIPRVGETCKHENITLEVIEAEPRRITRLRMTITPENGKDQND